MSQVSMEPKKTPKRQGLSKGKRFDVFERDNYTCKYCGNSVKDGAVLHVDHVIPISKGGGNDEINLVTACIDCNLGKSAKQLGSGKKPLDIKNITLSLEEELQARREYQEQLKKYYSYKKKLASFKSPHVKFINEITSEWLGYELTNQGHKDFARLFNQGGEDKFLEAIQITSSNKRNLDSGSKHKYLCGVLNNMIKLQNDPSFADEFKLKTYYLNHTNKRGTDYYVAWKIKPFVQELGLEFIKGLIDKTFQQRRGNYFEHLIELCQREVEDEN